MRQEHGETIHHWQEQLPTFLAGGGAADPAYRERLEYLSSGMVRIGLGGLLQRPLTKPERLRMPGILDDDFHRLAVAYGLAHDPLDLGDFIPRGDISPLDAPESRRHFEDAYVGTEQT